MKIALIGYGRMGKTIEELATGLGHQITHRIDMSGPDRLEDLLADDVDVAIEFTSPASAAHNVSHCLRSGIPVVSGSTGWQDQRGEVDQSCHHHAGRMLISSNFSIGVNIMFAINKRLAQIMNGFEDYEVEMKEIHHIHKLDAPSGTAITLADGIISRLDRKTGWSLDDADSGEVFIEAERAGEVPGTHEVTYRAQVDEIQIRHVAHSRQGFALGAIHAAQWLVGQKPGIYTMDDVLGL